MPTHRLDGERRCLNLRKSFAYNMSIYPVLCPALSSSFLLCTSLYSLQKSKRTRKTRLEHAEEQEHARFLFFFFVRDYGRVGEMTRIISCASRVQTCLNHALYRPLSASHNQLPISQKLISPVHNIGFLGGENLDDKGANSRTDET